MQRKAAMFPKPVGILEYLDPNIMAGNKEIYYKKSTDGGGTCMSERLTWNSGESVVPVLAT
jgi:hypothetical protein